MNETEEVTILIDLDRMPKHIGYIRDHDQNRGNYNRRIYDQQSYNDICDWVMRKIDSVNAPCNIQILGTLPSFLIMKLAINLYENKSVVSISQSKPGDCPAFVWEIERGTFFEV